MHITARPKPRARRRLTGAKLGHQRSTKPEDSTIPATDRLGRNQEERQWSERWLEAQMLSDLDLILSGGDTRRLAGRIGRSLQREMPAAEVVIARRSDNREVVLYGDRESRNALTADTDELRQSFGRFVVRVLVCDAHTTSRPHSYLRFAPLLLALAESRRCDLVTGSNGEPSRPARVVGSSPEMARLFDEAVRVARSEISVLICGESGTGKELFARHIHDSSARSHGPFIAVNCAGLPPDLVEAELFGVERGAATGVDARPGRFEQASGGTLLLDEIGDMAPRTQATILRALEDGLISRVGSTKPRPVSVRLIAATNREVDDLMRSGLFREDLYYRIASWVCNLPPLRDRRDDIPKLAAHFVSEIAATLPGSACGEITEEAMSALVSYDWPGNVRHLRNEVHRAAAIAPDDHPIGLEHLSPEVVHATTRTGHANLRHRLRSLERRIIQREIDACPGSLRVVADRLELPLSTLYRRMKALGVSPPGQRGSTPRGT
jgi:DNA-binding NtrC family response regulator